MSDPRGPAKRRADGEPIRAVVIAPPFDKACIAHEHPEDELGWLGDALGVDLVIVRFIDEWARPYSGDGTRNEQWFGWMHDILAPCDATVTHTQGSVSANTPGRHAGGRTGGIVFARGSRRTTSARGSRGS